MGKLYKLKDLGAKQASKDLVNTAFGYDQIEITFMALDNMMGVILQIAKNVGSDRGGGGGGGVSVGGSGGFLLQLKTARNAIIFVAIILTIISFFFFPPPVVNLF